MLSKLAGRTRVSRPSSACASLAQPTALFLCALCLFKVFTGSSHEASNQTPQTAQLIIGGGSVQPAPPLDVTQPPLLAGLQRKSGPLGVLTRLAGVASDDPRAREALYYPEEWVRQRLRGSRTPPVARMASVLISHKYRLLFVKCTKTAGEGRDGTGVRSPARLAQGGLSPGWHGAHPLPARPPPPPHPQPGLPPPPTSLFCHWLPLRPQAPPLSRPSSGWPAALAPTPPPARCCASSTIPRQLQCAARWQHGPITLLQRFPGTCWGGQSASTRWAGGPAAWAGAWCLGMPGVQAVISCLALPAAEACNKGPSVRPGLQYSTAVCALLPAVSYHPHGPRLPCSELGPVL